MGKSEKLVVLSVLLVVVLLFVWSLQGDGSDSGTEKGEIYASERDAVTEQGMTGRTALKAAGAPKAGAKTASNTPGSAGAAPLIAGADVATVGESGAPDPSRAGAAPNSPKMLLAETLGNGIVEVQPSSGRRPGSSSMADRAATSGNGVSPPRVRMQHGWDLVTTAGLQGTVDPDMFMYNVEGAEVTWESLARDLYADKSNATLLKHSNEGMDEPKGAIFVPSKDDLGHNGSVWTVEVLQGESLWQVAKRTLGKGSEWKAVYEANRDVIADPDLVAPGTMLKIPAR
jgi:nucleoid-associated protein YgaU